MSDNHFKIPMASATHRVLSVSVDDGTTEDADNRFELRANGQMEWGNGTDAQDVVMKRLSAGVLDITTGSLALNGTTVDATALEINRATDLSARMVTISADTTLTLAAHSDRIILLTGTGASKTVTLPAASGTGARYLFIVGAVNTSNHVITAPSGALMYGNIITNSTGDTPDLAQPWPADQSDDRTITLNGTTTGGQAIGDFVEVIDIATNKYFVRGVTTTSGTEATPFS